MPKAMTHINKSQSFLRMGRDPGTKNIETYTLRCYRPTYSFLSLHIISLVFTGKFKLKYFPFLFLSSLFHESHRKMFLKCVLWIPSYVRRGRPYLSRRKLPAPPKGSKSKSENRVFRHFSHNHRQGWACFTLLHGPSPCRQEIDQPRIFFHGSIQLELFRNRTTILNFLPSEWKNHLTSYLGEQDTGGKQSQQCSL